MNCAALTETLFESELFGHEKEAFTDAHEPVLASSIWLPVTLFLDGSATCAGGQAKLLRCWKKSRGPRRRLEIDPRRRSVIAATNQDLAEMVRQKKFRQDLFFRLNS